MKNLLLSLIAIAGLTAANNAFAAFHLEPWIGYETGKATFSATGIADSDTDFNGTAIGARVGYSMLGLMVGGEYSMANLKDDDDDDLKFTEYGIFAGYEFPVLIRVYATYMLKTEETENDLEGSGYKLGVGFTGLPFVAINLEAIYREFDPFNSFGIDIDTKSASYMLTVSLPLSL